MRIIDLSFHGSYLDSSADEYLQKAQPNTGYAAFLKDRHSILFVFHSGHNSEITKDSISYFFRRKYNNSMWLFPIRLAWWIRKKQPDVVLVHSIMYIHFAVFLKCFLRSGVQVFIQNHAEKVPRSTLKSRLVQFLDPYINGYLFTARELAAPWVERGLFSSFDKVHEVMEGSSNFKCKDRQLSRRALKISGERIFIWVGRLDSNKDPMCALKAFQRFAREGHIFKLYMFYHTEELLEDIQDYISANGLQQSILLMGYLPHENLETWFNAADFFISASHWEGSGYALCEAMSCGCIPVVTDIPSFRYITNGGKAGFLYEPGNEDALFKILECTLDTDIKAMKGRVLATFERRLCFRAIAGKIEAIFTSEK